MVSHFVPLSWTGIKYPSVRKQGRSSESNQPPVKYKGVQLVSRQNLASEIGDMKRIVDALTPEKARRIEEVWCDSKATATYSISIRDGLWESDMQWAINSAIYEACGGHNGVYFPQSGLKPPTLVGKTFKRAPKALMDH